MGDATAAIAAIDQLIGLIDVASLGIVTEGAQYVQRDARAEAHKLSGQNAESIVIEAAVNSGRRYGMMGVPLGPHAFSRRVGPTTVYGRIAEIGGPIPGRGKVMNHPYLRWWGADGKPIFARKVYHPAHPYLRPATERLRRQSYLGIATRRWSAAILSV